MSYQKTVQKGIYAIKRGDIANGTSLIRKAISDSDYDSSIVQASAYELSANHMQDIAFDILQEYLQAGGKDPAIYELMVKLSLDNNLPEIAKKLLDILITLQPSEPRHLVNYSNCLAAQEHYSEAISFLQNTIPQFPDYAPLWNALGYILSVHLGEHQQGLEFYLEAYRLDPKNFEVVNNIATVKTGTSEEELWYQRAIEIQPDHPTPHIGYSQLLFSQGRIVEALQHYEFRRSTNQGSNTSVDFSHNRQEWKGQPLKGKTIMIFAEQGIGDEMLFAINFSRIISMAESVILSCDDRLIPIFKRSFPTCEVVGYEDKIVGLSRIRHFPNVHDRLTSKKSDIDYVIPSGSLMTYLWQDISDVPLLESPLFIPDENLCKKVSHILGSNDEKPFKVGISWTSEKATGLRQNAYFSSAFYKGISIVQEAQFVNLQYTVNKETPKDTEDQGVLSRLSMLDDLDLRNDLDTQLAVHANLNLVIGPPTATQILALLSGTETYIITPGGLPWWHFGQHHTNNSALATNCKLFSSKRDRDLRRLLRDTIITKATKFMEEKSV